MSIGTNTPGNAPSGAYSYPPSVSADGRYVAFESLASLVPETEGNGSADIFVRDTEKGVTEVTSAPRRSRVTAAVIVLVAGWFLLGWRGRP